MKAARQVWDESVPRARGRCLCGVVRFEITVPARWAWHDHSLATQRAHGAAGATYVGAYKSRYRVTAGVDRIVRFERDGYARSFCGVCGSPLAYERPRAPEMVNIPRALFEERTGREPRYHIALEEAPDWAWRGEALVPLKGYPGVMWRRPKATRRG